MIPIPEKERKQIWNQIILSLGEVKDVNQRCAVVQMAISEFGPVPNNLGDEVRQALKAGLSGVFTNPSHEHD